MIRKLIFTLGLFFIFFLGGNKQGQAAHLYGGDIAYGYVGDTIIGGVTQHIYVVRLTAYYDCNDNRYPFVNPETISIFEGPLNATSLPLSSKVTDVQVFWADSTTLRSNLPPGCAVTTNVCVGKVTYLNTVILPTTFVGYHFIFDRCCRQVITNINGTVNTVGSVFHSWTASTATQNSSPVFRDLSRPFLCMGQQKTVVNLATDIDGNQLNYEFYHPYDGNASSGAPLYTGGYTSWPPDTITYATGYSLNQPFGGTGSAAINGLTGLTTIKAPNITGEFVVGVRVKEIDNNGFTVGVVHREFQFPVISCNDTNTFTPNLIAGSKIDYEIEAGDSLCFDIEFESQGANLGFEYEVVGEPFSAPTNPLATQTPVVFSGKTSKQTVCWKTSCAQGRTSKYFFTASVADSACLPGDTTIVYSILVRPFEGPQTITGPNQICSGMSSLVYSTDTIAGATYSWTVTGGTIVGSATGPSITVDWGTSAGGNVRVFATSQFGCASTPIDYPVSVSNFTVIPGADRSICLGDTTFLGSTQALPTAPTGFSILWSPSNTLDNDTSQNPRAFPTQTTTYTITVTDTNGICTVVDSVTVTVLQNLNAGIQNSDTTICEGSQVQLQAFGGLFYKWSPASAVTDDTIANPMTTINQTTTIICEITDTGGVCPTIDTVVVTVQNSLGIDAGPDSSICLNDNYTMGGSPSGPTGSTYIWSPATGLSSTTAENPILTPTGTGTTDYAMQVTTPAGCVFNDTVTISVDTVPVLRVIVLHDTICAGELDTINVDGANFYTWIPSTLPQNQSFQFVQPTTTTEYIVTGTDLNFCSSSDTFEIVVNPIPEITIPFDSVFLCFGDTMQLTTTPGATRYKWTPNTNILPHDSAASPRVFPSTSTTYTVNISDLNGCDNVDSIFILVDDTVPTDAGPATTICLPDTVQIGGSPTSLLFNTTFSWSPGSTLVDSTLANPSTFTTTQTTYVVTSRNGNCIGFDSVVVSVSPQPVLSYAQNPFELCQGDSVQLDTNGLTGTIQTFSWNPTTKMTDTTTVTPFVSPDTSITYTISYTDNLGCTGSTDVRVDVTNSANIDAGPDTIACENVPITLNVSGGSTYVWSPGLLLDDSTSATPTTTLTSDTTFIVNGTNALGCTGIDTIIVRVAPAPVADAGGPFIVCADSIASIVLGGNPTGPTGATYAWSDPQFLDNASLANPTTSFILPKVYTLIVQDTNGCIAVDSAIVNNFTFDVQATVGECNGDSIQLSVSNVFGTAPFTYQWTPNYALSADNIANPVSTTDSSLTYQVLVTDSNGCQDSADAFVLLNSIIKADFDLEVLAGCDEAIVSTINRSQNATDFQWYVNDVFFSSDYDIQFPIEFEASRIVRLIATDGGNCVDTLDEAKNILTFDDYFVGEIPNVFSPNGDGMNDVFDVQIGQRLEGCTSIKIYNRWGSLIYESRDNDHSWDGRTFTGELCKTGVYFYLLDINGTEFQGNVTLIRD